MIKKMYTKYKEIINYLIFGVLTTVISLIVYYGLTYTIINPDNAVMLQVANVISWIAGVLFAYFTNRKLVFNSTAVTIQEKLKEFGKFILGRAFTMVVESVGFWLLFSVMNITALNGLVSKLIISVVVIILNFFISKFFAFKK